MACTAGTHAPRETSCGPGPRMNSPSSRTHSALIPPPLAPGACIRAFYWHDVPATPDSDPAQALEQRLSRIPANPYVSLVWLTEGEAQLVEAYGAPCAHRLSGVFLAGPTQHGWRSLANPAYRSFGVVLQPAAFALLSGADVHALPSPAEDARARLDATWHPFLDGVAQARDHASRVALATAFFTARWQAVRASRSVWARLIEQAWSAPAQRAAMGVLAWTARHFQRRTRALTGMSPGEVARLIRLENALRALRDTPARVADVAADHGYADQAHFTREVRRAYGRSPARLLRDVRDAGKPGDWLLRL